jgi:3-oxoacyl-[acyl-carrier protein] reductase
MPQERFHAADNTKNNFMSVSQKTVLITGGTRGLGLATVSRLAAQGYQIVATGRKVTPELEVLISAGGIHFEELDLASHEAIHETINRITSTYGYIYGLVNNAAVGYDGILATMHDSQISELVSVNLTGTILVTKYAVRSMLLRREGRIINVSSIIATTGFNGLSVYAATKAALNGFTRSLAREVGKAGITVNTVAPGYMQTDMTVALQDEKLESIKRRSPLGRLATVRDCAAAISFLLGPDASSVTGTTITVDAGSTA